jgi:hypothetical protein
MKVFNPEFLKQPFIFCFLANLLNDDHSNEVNLLLVAMVGELADIYRNSTDDDEQSEEEESSNTKSSDSEEEETEETPESEQTPLKNVENLKQKHLAARIQFEKNWLLQEKERQRLHEEWETAKKSKPLTEEAGRNGNLKRGREQETDGKVKTERRYNLRRRSAVN